MTVMYIHGLGSSGNSTTATNLKNYFKDAKIIAPDIPFNPNEAIEYIKKLAYENMPDIIVGTSLGGFYTMQISGFKKLIINPLIDVSGIKQFKGKHEYFSERKDNEKFYDVNDEYIDSLKSLSDNFWNNIYDKELVEETHAIFGVNDMVIDSRDIYINKYKYYKLINANHRMSNENLICDVCPYIGEIINTEQIKYIPWG